MQLDPKTEGRRWLEQARRDLDDARFARTGHRHNLTCFLSQQAAEKALKGLLILRGREEVWGHSVADLCEQTTELDPSFEELRGDAAGLDVYYIPTRYPNGLPGGLPADAFDATDSDRALTRSERIIDAVRRAFGESPPEEAEPGRG